VVEFVEAVGLHDTTFVMSFTGLDQAPEEASEPNILMSCIQAMYE